MELSETCIRRPVMTTLITASLIVFGIFAYRLLSVAALPAVDFPTIQITATLPGASPETMARLGRRPDRAAAFDHRRHHLAHLDLGARHHLDHHPVRPQPQHRRRRARRADGAHRRGAQAADRNDDAAVLPQGQSGRLRRSCYISLISSTLPLSAVDDYGEITLAQQISQLPGVAQVLVFGAQKFAVRVQVDPVAAAARDISLDDVRTVLAKTNSNTPVGTLDRAEAERHPDGIGAMRKADEYRNVVVAYRNGAPVKLERNRQRHRQRRERQDRAAGSTTSAPIVLAIQRSRTPTRSRSSMRSVSACRSYRAQIPASIKMEVLADRSVSIREFGRGRAGDAGDRHRAGRPGDLPVPALGRRRPSFPSLAVPISLIGTCAAMYAFGFSINNMTLLALTLSVGFVVDDAIVMLENIVRHIEGGMRPFEAALKGSREIGFTIVSITFSLIAVFIPVLLMGGMVGRVFREFAVTIAVAIMLVRLRLADADADAVRARAASAITRARSRTSCCASSRRCSKRGCAATSGRSTWCCKYKSVMLVVTLGDARRHGLALHRHSEGLLPDRGHRLHLRHRPKARRTFRSSAMVERAAAGRGDHPLGPGGRLRQFHGRRRRAEPDRQYRPRCSSRSSRATSATKTRQR